LSVSDLIVIGANRLVVMGAILLFSAVQACRCP
jgi:hypothetical protein